MSVRSDVPTSLVMFAPNAFRALRAVPLLTRSRQTGRSR
jgi:hypothetical protein